MWVLILTFYVYGVGQSYSPALTSQAISGYASKEDCNKAASDAAKGFTGGAKVEWTCVLGGIGK